MWWSWPDVNHAGILRGGYEHFGSLKSAVGGIFIPQKMAIAVN